MDLAALHKRGICRHRRVLTLMSKSRAQLESVQIPSYQGSASGARTPECFVFRALGEFFSLLNFLFIYLF